MGELIPLQPTDRGHTETGIFVLPQPVKSCGRLVSIEAIGFFKVSHQTADRYGFGVQIYGNECSGMYQEVHQMNFAAACINESFTTSHERSCHVRLDNINFAVKEGDFIAVEVLDGCNNAGSACPLQPVIVSRTNQTTQSVVLFLVKSDINSFSSFQNRTDVFLNIKALIEGTLFYLKQSLRTLHCA